MRDIFKGTVMPKSRRQLEDLAYIFSCPACEYELPCQSQEAAEIVKLTHCRTSGGIDHDRLIVDHHFMAVFG